MEADVSTGAAPVSAATAGPDPSMARRVGGNSLWLIARPLILNVLSIASNLYIVRKLGAADYGAFNLGFAQVALFSPLCNLGLRAVAVRAIAEDRARGREIVGALFALRLVLTAIAVLLIAGWLALPTYSLTTRLIGAAAVCSMVCTSLGGSVIDLFQGFERARLSAQPQLIGGVVLTLLSVLALLAGWGLPGFVVAYVLGAAIQLLLMHWTARRALFAVRPVWDWPRMKLLALQARPFAVLSILSNVTDVPVIDVLILGAVLGAGAVGPYTAALGLVLRLLMIPHGIGDALYPAVAAYNRHDRSEVETTLRRCILNLALITLPAAVCLMLTARTVLGLLYGSEYLSAAPALGLAGWLLPLMGINYVMRECLSAVHRQGEVLKLTFLSCLLMVALYAILIPSYGIVGAVVAGLAREVLMLGLWARPFRREFGRPFPVRDMARVVPVLALLALPILLVGNSHGYPAVVAAVAGGGALYAVASLALGLVPVKAATLWRVRARA
jgi:O-antigen/teichoic acid export membrane protein